MAPRAASPRPTIPDLRHFQRLDERVRYLNQKGITADLTIASSAGGLAKLFPTPAARRRLMAFLVGRYAGYERHLAGSWPSSKTTRARAPC